MLLVTVLGIGILLSLFFSFSVIHGQDRTLQWREFLLSLGAEFFFRPSLTAIGEEHLTLIPDIAYGGEARKKALGQMDKYPYKFFTPLIFHLYHLTQQKGAPLKEPLQELRKHLHGDVNFEKTISQFRNSAYTQYVAIVFLSWTMVLVMHLILKASVSEFVIALVVLWQCLGIFLYRTLEKKMIHRHLHPLNRYLQVFMVLDVCRVLPASLAQIKTLSGLDQLKWSDHSELPAFNRRVHSFLDRWGKGGIMLEEETQLFLADLSFIRDKSRHKVLRQLEGVKLTIAVVFFGTSYFALIGIMLSDLALLS